MRIAVIYSIGVQEGLIKGLRKLGHEVIPLFNGLTTNKMILKLRYPKYRFALREIENRFNNQIEKFGILNKKKKVDAIIFFRGYALTNKSKKIIQETNATKISWATDSFERFTAQRELAAYMDKVFVCDELDADNKKNQWLPLGFDDELFAYQEKKDIDLLLLGDISQPQYKTRLEYIIEASGLGKEGVNITFAGSGLNQRIVKKLHENKVKTYRHQPFEKYAKMISRSKICVNIQQDDGGRSINPLFFAIPACGGIQITEEKNYLDKWLNPNVDFFPISINLLNKTIVTFLATQKRFEKINAEKIREFHSYVSRAATILN